ncbi:MAG: YdbH domain-containing protein, partial [Alphaproteobacteria bacterium]
FFEHDRESMTVFGKRTLSVIVALLAVIGLAIIILPWKGWVGKRLEIALEAQGLQNVHLTVESLGLTSITLKNITVGGTPPLALDNVVLDYSLPDLLKGKVQKLNLSGLHLDVRSVGGHWGVMGLENYRNSNKKPFLFPVTEDEISTLPLGDVRFEKSFLHLTADAWQADIPLDVTWLREPVPSVLYKSTGLTFKNQSLQLMSGETYLEGTLDKAAGQWNGIWRIQDIQIMGSEPPTPPLKAEGSFSVLSNEIKIKGTLTSADQSYKSNFNFTYLLWSPDKSELLISSAEMPWNNGSLSVKDIRVPMKGAEALYADVQINRVSTDILLQKLTGNKATASGTISGHIPITLGKNGNFTVHQGSLQTEEPGIIKMAPEAIPGENQQVALVREVLKDFHYKLLAISVNTDANNNLKVLMSLEGNNPAVYEGKTVKMSVHLTGDVLDFVQQNLLWLSNPKKFLEQDTNAKK